MNFQGEPPCGRARCGVAVVLMLSDYIVPSFCRSAWFTNNKKKHIHESTWQSACTSIIPKLRQPYMNFQSGPPADVPVMGLLSCSCSPALRACPDCRRAHILLIANTFVSGSWGFRLEFRRNRICSLALSICFFNHFCFVSSFRESRYLMCSFSFRCLYFSRCRYSVISFAFCFVFVGPSLPLSQTRSLVYSFSGCVVACSRLAFFRVRAVSS